MEENLNGMREVVECLKHEPDGYQEKRMAQSAEVAITQAKEILNMISFIAA